MLLIEFQHTGRINIQGGGILQGDTMEVPDYFYKNNFFPYIMLFVNKKKQ